MCLATIASQLEIVALGVIAQGQGAPAQGFLGNLLTLFNDTLNVSLHIERLALFLVLVAFFKAVTLFIYRFLTRRMAIEVSAALRTEYFQQLERQPMAFFQAQDMGSLTTRVVGEAAMVAEAINSCLINYLQTPFTLISTLTLCFFASWQLTWVILVGFPLLLLPISYLARGVKRLSKQIHMTQDRLACLLLDFLGGIQTVKAFNMEAFALEKYGEANEKIATLEKRSARYDLATRPIVHTVAMSFLALALIYGLYFLQMAVSEVLVYVGFLYLFYEPIKKFAEENSHIQRGLAAAERLHAFASLPKEEEGSAEVFPGKFSYIEARGVYFAYPQRAEQWALEDFSFHVHQGQMVALVGPTGAGKSTVLQLLLRFYDPQQGGIFIDGQPLGRFGRRTTREAIAFVPQKPFLFADTVAANIAYGRGYSFQEVERAAQRAHAAEFIEKLPQGYQTVLAEGGKNLSGGQQQRLAIARALIKKAPLLLLDEVTSALDAFSEQQIKESLERLRGEVTQLIIAHRLSTIASADQILYMEKGRLVAAGTKAELLESCAGFSAMWELMHS